MTTPEFYKRPALTKRAHTYALAYAKRYSGESLKALLASKFTSAQRAAVADTKVLTHAELGAALGLPDHSDANLHRHAIGLMLDEMLSDVQRHLKLPVKVQRDGVLVSPRDNYLNLGFDEAAVARDRKHAHYVNDDLMLRTHVSAAVPGLLRSFQERALASEAVFALPGRVFRRDAVDRTHLTHPHQVDIWRFSEGRKLTVRDLESTVAHVMHSILPGADWRFVPGSHPYSRVGRQIDVWFDNAWLEIGECGVANAKLFSLNGLDPRRWSALGIGIGLERAVMLRKGITDIRYVDSRDGAMMAQMRNLNLIDPDLLRRASYTERVRVRHDPEQDLETIGDAARRLLGSAAAHLEEVTASRAPQEGFLELDITLSALDRELTSGEVAALFDVLHCELAEACSAAR